MKLTLLERQTMSKLFRKNYEHATKREKSKRRMVGYRPYICSS